MERVAIFLRKSATENNFRRVLLSAFREDDFEHITICSGFFQERGKYFASDCFIKSPPHLACKRTVDVVGVYNGIWKGDFDKFVIGLRKITCGCGSPINIIKKRIKRYHWHAKIFIASDHNGPQLGIIGSSNITSRAFGLLPQWNFESDVILWNDSNPTAKKVMTSLFAENASNDATSIIVSDYSPEDTLNKGLTLQRRLSLLEEEINELSEEIE